MTRCEGDALPQLIGGGEGMFPPGGLAVGRVDGVPVGEAVALIAADSSEVEAVLAEFNAGGSGGDATSAAAPPAAAPAATAAAGKC